MYLVLIGGKKTAQINLERFVYERLSMGILIQPWHLIVFAIVMFLVFFTIGKMSKR